MRRSRWPFFRDVVGSSAASRPVRRSVKGKRPLWDCVGLPRGQGFLGLGGQCMQSYGSPMECLGTIPGPTRPNLISEVTNRPVKGHLETPKGLRTGGPGSDALVTLCASDHCFRPPFSAQDLPPFDPLCPGQKRRKQLQDAFSKHLHFTSGALQVRPAELPELWRCLGLLGVQRTRIEQLAEDP